ncbi:MAG: farnesyl diphosphate synthase [Planctomycetota bacterium]
MRTKDESLVPWLEETRVWAEVQLEAALAGVERGPARHTEALRYALFSPGKRLRPALVRLVCEHLGGTDEQAGPAAAAVEMIHTYSLVHDDLPCMDDDDLRRGRPTCHKVYGDAEAVLVGDSLQALAFEWLALRGGPRAAQQVAVLAASCGLAGLVGGQSLDLASDGSARFGVEEVREIHSLKTAALVSAAVDLGALAAGAGESQRVSMRAFGRALGLCFQAVDDILDVTGDAASLGKTPGKDAAGGKATLVASLGLEGARAEARHRAQAARACATQAGCGEDSLALALVDHFLARSS